jgi:hypothetical protein
MKFQFGTDPEFAVRSANRIVSAIPVLMRDKHDKIDLGDGAAIYHDNVLAEANIAPCDSAAALRDRLRDLYTKAKTVLNNHRLMAVASNYFEEEECEHPEAKRFGCDPELDAYAGCQAYPPNSNDTFRSAGGHVHIGGITEQDVYKKLDLVFLMDALVGVPSVIMDNDPTSLARKRLYGKAGRFRDTDYGLEYRTLSNFWLSNPELTDIIYNLTKIAAETFEEGRTGEVLGAVNFNEVARIINEADKTAAYEFVKTLPIEDSLKARIFAASESEYSADIFENWGI